MKKKKQEPGNILELLIRENLKIYARILEFPLVAYYKEYDKENKILKECIFEALTSKSSFKDAKYIDWIELTDKEKIPRKYYRFDIIKKVFFISCNGVETESKKEDILDLQRLAVWDLPHISERAIAYFEGRESKYLKSLESVKYG